MEPDSKPAPTQAEIDDESRRARRLRMAVNLALELIARGEVSYEEALEMIAATRRVAVNLFPGKGETFDLLYRPKFDRLMREVYRIQ
jgi:hypothetical protein